MHCHRHHPPPPYYLVGSEAQWLSGVEEPEAGSPVAVDDMSQLDLLLKSIQNDAA